MMTLATSWCLLSLCVLLVFSIVPTGTEVVNSILDCKEFFLQGNPPDIKDIMKDGKILDQNRYKPICQTFENKRRFVTLYDIRNKIPVFSAYKFIGSKVNSPDTWKIEPQLEDIRDDKNMKGNKEGKTLNNQAQNVNYDNKLGWDRGHLFPVSHGFDTAGKVSTLTLTNAVPHFHTCNRAGWKDNEKIMRDYMTQFCINNNEIEAAVMTGAVPGTSPPLNNKINIPSYLWSAFCCYNSATTKMIGKGFWAPNVDKCKVEIVSLGELNIRLGKDSLVFPKATCPLN
ncbi:hypothetical protein LDENG_00118970 [Lucifuga dentata]|nr:hypothetical protein LDENG_00118970 [Lucifuga dentata]